MAGSYRTTCNEFIDKEIRDIMEIYSPKADDHEEEVLSDGNETTQMPLIISGMSGYFESSHDSECSDRHEKWLLKNYIRQFGQTISLPVKIAMVELFLQSPTFIAPMIIAHAGEEYLGPIFLVNSSLSFLITASSAVLLPLSFEMSAFEAAGDLRSVGTMWQQAYVISVCASPLIMIALSQIKPILMALWQTPADADRVQEFYDTYLWIVPMQLALNADTYAILGLKKIGQAGWVSMLSTVLFGFTCTGLSLGKFGMPKLKMKGIAYAYLIQVGFNFFVYKGLMLFHNSYRGYELFSWRYQGKMKNSILILKRGGMIYAQYICELLNFQIFTACAGKINALLTMQIMDVAIYLNNFTYRAIAEGSSIQISADYAKRAYLAMQNVAKTNFILGCGVSVVYTGIWFSVAPLWAKFYIDTEAAENHEIMSQLRRVFFISLMISSFDLLRHVALGNLRGIRDIKNPVILQLLLPLTCGLPAYLLTHHEKEGGLPGLLGIYAAGFFLTSLLTNLRVFVLFKRLPSFPAMPTFRFFNCWKVESDRGQDQTCCSIYTRILDDESVGGYELPVPPVPSTTSQNGDEYEEQTEEIPTRRACAIM